MIHRGKPGVGRRLEAEEDHRSVHDRLFHPRPDRPPAADTEIRKPRKLKETRWRRKMMNGKVFLVLGYDDGNKHQRKRREIT